MALRKDYQVKQGHAENLASSGHYLRIEDARRAAVHLTGITGKQHVVVSQVLEDVCHSFGFNNMDKEAFIRGDLSGTS